MREKIDFALIWVAEMVEQLKFFHDSSFNAHKLRNNDESPPIKGKQWFRIAAGWLRVYYAVYDCILWREWSKNVSGLFSHN